MGTGLSQVAVVLLVTIMHANMFGFPRECNSIKPNQFIPLPNHCKAIPKPINPKKNIPNYLKTIKN